jgi:lipopolysaccharide transport system ATP-binding protein
VRTRTKTVSKFTQLKKIMSQAYISDIPTTSTANQEVLVKVEGVSKKFCRSLKRSLWYGVCDIAGELNPFAKFGAKGIEHGVAGSNPRVTCHSFADGPSPKASVHVTSEARDADLRDGEFYAVRDVSFELRRGECLGLIGHNGAGKTTLLKMLNGLIKPDSGRIEMNGRVAALIALGAGFNPILTGRENIYINGSVLGLSKKEIDGRIDEIIDFAEIGEFIDMPVQNYSSGMQVRLGFAVATALEPDVLILDEVLAVGDARFRSKCYRRIAKLRHRAAVIFVSHAMEQIGRICSSAIVLSMGKSLFDGNTSEAIQIYENLDADNSSVEAGFHEVVDPFADVTVKISERHLSTGDPLVLVVEAILSKPHPSLTARIVFYDRFGNWVADAINTLTDQELIPSGRTIFRLTIDSITLKAGAYDITIHFLDGKGEIKVWLHKQISLEIVGARSYANASCQLCLAVKSQSA